MNADIHCHILPGLDDRADMDRLLASQGYAYKENLNCVK